MMDVLQIGGGGTYATIGARIWLIRTYRLKCDGIDHVLCRLSADQLGMIIDRGRDFPEDVYAALMNYGEQMWVFRDRDDGLNTLALNLYRGEHRESVQLACGCLSPLMSSRFQYLTPRVRITPGDLYETRISRPRMLHFVCSPIRAAVIMTQVHEIGNWDPVTIYEPIPVCISAYTKGMVSTLLNRIGVFPVNFQL